MDKMLLNKNFEIENLIYEISGKQVMLDSDLARLYGVETKRINEAVKNNTAKFPERYSWRLSNFESEKLLDENFDQKYIERRGGRFKNPRVFTEQGVAMLATVLRSKIAVDVSISIMDAFVSMRHFLLDNSDVYKSLSIINNKLAEYDEKFKYIFSIFDKKEQLFFPGEEYDAYRKIVDIFNAATSELIIIDSYADISLLDFIKNVNSQIILITSNKAKISDFEINKFNTQYNKLKVIKDNTFHDRYFILDKTKVYHSGTSINYAGRKMFSINLIEDKLIIDSLLEYIENIL